MRVTRQYGEGMKRLAWLILAAACTEQSEPVRGPEYTYVVDGFTLPATSSDARVHGCDVDGDGDIENVVGVSIAYQASEGNLTPYVADLLGSGAIASRVIIQAESLTNDRAVGVRYIGHDEAPSAQIVGDLEDGTFVTMLSGSGVARLPVLIDADVSQIQVNRMRITLTSDGAGGFDALVCGAVPQAEAAADAARALLQMAQNNPADHPYIVQLFDRNVDGELTLEEIETNSLFAALFASDLNIDGVPSVSLGFVAHLSPCPDGVCPAPPAVANPCEDRVRGGDESDVDCGGSLCDACASGRACDDASDCASAACDAGVCRAATCDDGAVDGFETDVDCGWHCGPCASGQTCERDADCTSGACIDATETCQ